MVLCNGRFFFIKSYHKNFWNFEKECSNTSVEKNPWKNSFLSKQKVSFLRKGMFFYNIFKAFVKFLKCFNDFWTVIYSITVEKDTFLYNLFKCNGKSFEVLQWLIDSDLLKYDIQFPWFSLARISCISGPFSPPSAKIC